MTNDFGSGYAQEIAAQFINGDPVSAPPGTVYVTLYDDTGTELNASLENSRVGVSVPAGWQQGADPTQFENAVQVDFGEAEGELDVQEFAIKRNDAVDGSTVIYYRDAIADAPQTFADATQVFFAPGALTVNVLDVLND